MISCITEGGPFSWEMRFALREWIKTAASDPTGTSTAVRQKLKENRS